MDYKRYPEDYSEEELQDLFAGPKEDCIDEDDVIEPREVAKNGKYARGDIYD